jgi:hypothetical protein
MAALALSLAVGLGLWVMRARREFRRGERFWLRHPFRMVRAVALVGMAAMCWWMLATLLSHGAESTPAPVKFAGPLLLVATSAILATAAILGLAPRRPRHR